MCRSLQWLQKTGGQDRLLAALNSDVSTGLMTQFGSSLCTEEQEKEQQSIQNDENTERRADYGRNHVEEERHGSSESIKGYTYQTTLAVSLVVLAIFNWAFQGLVSSDWHTAA